MSRVTIFIGASWLGLGGIVLAGAGVSLLSSTTILLVGLVVSGLCAIAMLATRRADEFTLSLWNAGASVAFGTMLIALPGIPFAEGVFDGFMGNESGQDIPATLAPIFAILAFYIGVTVKRALGDM